MSNMDDEIAAHAAAQFAPNAEAALLRVGPSPYQRRTEAGEALGAPRVYRIIASEQLKTAEAVV